MKIIAYKLWVCEGTLAATHGHYYSIVEFYIPDLELCINEHAFLKYYEARYDKVLPENKMTDYPDPEMIGCHDLPSALLEPLVTLRHSLSIDRDDLHKQLSAEFKEKLEKDKDITLDNDA